MKTCATCDRLYADDSAFCPSDGSALVPVSEAPLPSNPDDPRVGKTYCNGRFQIRRTIADGGMGRVYEAVDLREHRGVALKVLHEEVAADEVSVERFRREFEVSASLPHDHIVEVFAFESTEDESYALVMEYLEGEELRTVLKRERSLPPARVIRMMSQVAIGLGAAHARQIVHRDLKPDNLFLLGSSDGDVVKLLDFGSVRDNSEGAKKLTVMGTTIGSPFYMAPEQAQGLEALDHRADVWAIAAMVYECLTGVVPFAGPTGASILLAILTKEPDLPSTLKSSRPIPAELDTVMEEALTKNPAIRIGSVADLVDRIGAAYALEGDHKAWAVTPESELATQVDKGLVARKSQPEPALAPKADLRALDAVFQQEAAATFEEDLVMGVPSNKPSWVVPVVVGVLVLAAAAAFFLLR